LVPGQPKNKKAAGDRAKKSAMERGQVVRIVNGGT